MEVELNAEQSFFDLHTLIQKSLAFESHQLASFFISDNNWRKHTEISMLDLGINASTYYIMQKTRLSDLIHSENQKLIYTFDFFDDRSFYIELTGIIMKKNLNEPLVTLKQGDTPVQVLGDEMFEQESANLQEEEVFMDFGEVDDYTQLYGEMEDF
ncbi:MAG: IS1096 element passenger TnpR family protein [Prolixibacteraceae bacterium]